MRRDRLAEPSEACVPPECPFADVEEPDDADGGGRERDPPPDERSEDGEQQEQQKANEAAGARNALVVPELVLADDRLEIMLGPR